MSPETSAFPRARASAASIASGAWPAAASCSRASASVHSSVASGVSRPGALPGAKVNHSPVGRWMQRSGLEWLFRLLTNPRRLWRRYLIYNPKFVYQFARQAAGLQRFGEG